VSSAWAEGEYPKQRLSSLSSSGPETKTESAKKHGNTDYRGRPSLVSRTHGGQQAAIVVTEPQAIASAVGRCSTINRCSM
jgi:hypothetical protein